MDTPCPFPPKSKIITYARDSGGDEQERSVDQQNAAYQAYAEQHQLVIARAFDDRARPGSSTLSRTGFEDFIAYLRTHTPSDVAGALLWKLNRFARNLDDSQFFKADLRRRGYVLHFMADNIPQGQGDLTAIFETLLEWKAARDRADISSDAKRGLADLVQRKKADGSYEGFVPGVPPKGFMREIVVLGNRRNGKPHTVSRWVLDPTTSEKCRRAWELRAQGVSVNDIHAELSLFNSLNSYTTFFSNPIYKGELHFGDLVLANFVPALCTAEQWAAVEKIREANKQFDPTRHPRRVDSPFTCTKFAHCAACGGRLHGNTMGRNKWRCYECKPCALRVSAAKVEEAVVDAVLEHILHPGQLRQLYEKGQSTTPQQLQEQIAAAERELVGTKRAITNLLNLAETNPTPSLTERLAEREAQRAALATRIADLTAQLQRPTYPVLTPEQITQLTAQLRAELLTGDPGHAQRVLTAFVVRLEITKERGKAWLAFPRSIVDPVYTGTGGAPMGAHVISVLFHRPRCRHPQHKAERNAQIRLEHTHGVTIRQLMDKYGLSEARICQILRNT